jgi:hypothetical protein
VAVLRVGGAGNQHGGEEGEAFHIGRGLLLVAATESLDLPMKGGLILPAMNDSHCLKCDFAVHGPAAMPGCIRHCVALAWRAFVGMLRQLG